MLSKWCAFLFNFVFVSKGVSSYFFMNNNCGVDQFEKSLSLDGFIYDVYTIGSHKAINYLACAVDCFYNVNCLSVVFDEQTSSCSKYFTHMKDSYTRRPISTASYLQLKDPDNCADIVVPCGTNAVCLNKRQNDSCVCNPGLTGDGQTCSEENECLTGSNNCDVNADCTDVVGSYTCACKPGFNGDGRTCTDNNECSTPNVCHENANCTNTLGSYTCHCNHMYEGDGVICNLEKIRGQTCTQASDCIRSNFTCSSGLCDCDVGYSYDGDSNTCVIRCDNYGSEFSHQSTTYCVTGYNNAVINVNTYTECRQYCLTTSSFTCRTFELWNGACYLSSAVKTEVPDSKWAAWTGCKYYQRHCA